MKWKVKEIEERMEVGRLDPNILRACMNIE